MASVVRLVGSLLVLVFVALPLTTPQEASNDPLKSNRVAHSGVGRIDARTVPVFVDESFDASRVRFPLANSTKPWSDGFLKSIGAEDRGLLSGVAGVVQGGLAVSTEARIQAAVAGQWVGVFHIRKQVAWLRLKFEKEPHRVKLLILASQPGAATAGQEVELDSSRIRFAVTADSAQLVFDGRFDDDRISGMVTRGDDRGTFQLVREPFIDPRQYDDYVGAYELARNRFIIIRRGDRLKAEAPFSVEQSYLYFVDHSDRTRALFPVSQDSFFAGPSFLVPLPARIHVGFVRDSQGTVTGLKWRETGRPEAFAPKSTRYTEESVRFQNGAVTLACRLLIPSGARPSPAVLFVQGGAWSRDAQRAVSGRRRRLRLARHRSSRL